MSHTEAKNVTVEPLAVSPDGASARLGISTRAAYLHLSTGEIRSFKDGKRRLIPFGELQRFIDKRMAEAEDERPND